MDFNAHGGDIYTYFDKYGKVPLDFSVNINPLGMPKGLLDGICQMEKEFSSYPDVYSRVLVEKIARNEKVKNTNVLCGNGAADLIFATIIALKPQKALIPKPTFSEYEKALNNVNAKVDYIDLYEKDGFELTADLFIASFQNHDIAFICSPNNPTGRAENIQELIKIATFCKENNCILVIDQCFVHFSEQEEEFSFSPYIEQFDNVILLKAFTKTYSMAGIRLGYLINSDVNLVHKIRKSMQAWSVSALAQICGVRAIENAEYIHETKRIVSEERKFLTEKLQNFGFKVYVSHANYILFKTDIDKLDEKLQKRGIMIRSCANYHNLSDEFYRIAVKIHDDNVKLINEMEEIVNG